jgi:hypothetical protein
MTREQRGAFFRKLMRNIEHLRVLEDTFSPPVAPAAAFVGDGVWDDPWHLAVNRGASMPPALRDGSRLQVARGVDRATVEKWFFK